MGSLDMASSSELTTATCSETHMLDLQFKGTYINIERFRNPPVILVIHELLNDMTIIVFMKVKATNKIHLRYSPDGASN